MPVPTAALGPRPHQPFLDDGSHPVGGIERLEAPDMNDLVLNRDQSGSEQLGQDAAPRRRLQRAQHQTAAGVVSEAIDRRLYVALVRPWDGRRPAGDQHPTAPQKVDAGDH